jgi:uncharacterized protein DUF4242
MRFRTFAALVALSLVVPALGAAEAAKAAVATKAQPAPAVPVPAPGMHRYMVVRTFPAGALDGLDTAGKKQVNDKNAAQSVRWVHSFANADKTKTFCIYEGPSEKAVRDAADANKIPVDYIVEIPVVLTPR